FGVGPDATFGTDPLGRRARGGDDRSFFDRHRDQEVPAVDREVGGDTERDWEVPDDVFDQVLGDVERQGALPRQDVDILVVELADLPNPLQSLGSGQAMKSLSQMPLLIVHYNPSFTSIPTGKRV